MVTSKYISSASELGQWARSERKAQRLTLQSFSDRARLGIRFLSEFERGKETAELGKALAALDALGLRLAPAKDASARATTDSESVPESQAPPPPVQTPIPVIPARAASEPDPGPRPVAGGNTARLWDMLLAAGDIQEMLGACAEEADFRQSMVMQRAVERCFDVIGEAARRVTPEAQARLPRIPWRALIARRNGLVMAYEQVNHGALFQAAQMELPGLIAELRAGLAATGGQVGRQS